MSSCPVSRARVWIATSSVLALAWISFAAPTHAQQLAVVTVGPSGSAAGVVPPVSDILAMTPDEQYVAFCSAGQNLDPTKTDTNGIGDVYRRHLPSGITMLVSVSTDGTTAGNGACPMTPQVRISTDGRYVAFMSEATNLVSGITDTTSHDLFVRDMQTGTTSLVTVNAAGTQAVGTVNGAAFDLSDDGRSMLFASRATTIVAGFVDGNGSGSDVYRRDLQTGTTTLVSRSHLGATRSANGPSYIGAESHHVMSADGGKVAFVSTAADLINGFTPNPTPPSDVLYVRDMQTNTVKVVDRVGNAADFYEITADGKWVTYRQAQQIYARDMDTTSRLFVSISAAGITGGNDASINPRISRYPRTHGQQDYVIAFQSRATDLVSGVTVTPPADDTVYARWLGGSTVLVGGVPGGATTGDGRDVLRGISPDGRYIAFMSNSTNLVSGVVDTNADDMFRRDLIANTTVMLTLKQPGGTTGAQDLKGGSVGHNGGVLFHTTSNLLPADTYAGSDLYFFGEIPEPAIYGNVTAPDGGPLTDVTLTLTGTSPGTTTTDGMGTYDFSPLTSNGTYTVTPSQAGLTFTPASRTIANLLGAQRADFVGSPVVATYTISGQVRDLNDTGVAGVTMTLSGGASATSTTDLDGRYAFAGLAPGGTYTVTPSKSTFTFTAPSQTFPNLQRNEVAAFFVANVGTFTRYFAEGATGSFFDTTIALLNATGSTADVTVRFLKEDGTQSSQTLTMAGLARATVDPEQLSGTESAAFATVIESTQPIIADRRMEWDAGRYASHGETSLARPETTWYLAEGATTGSFNLYYLLQNPSTTQTAEIEIRYLRPTPLQPIVKTYTVGPASRRTIHVNGEDPDLDEAEISAVVRSTNGVAIIVERSMYTNAAGQLFGAGHESAAIPNLATQWFLAEGATLPFFHLFILIANPSDQDASIDVRYLLPDGRVIVKPYIAAANSRLTIGVHAEGPDLASTPLSMTVTSTNQVPVLVERAMWWPASAPEWYEGHNSAGVVASGEKWGVADGQNGGPWSAQSFILIANTSAQTANVEVKLIFEDGTTDGKTYTIAGNSRFNVHVPGEFPTAQDRRFGAVVESLPTGGGAPAQIVVERSVYSDAAGLVFAAGANAPGAKLR